MYMFGQRVTVGPYRQRLKAYEAIYMSTSQEYKIREVDQGGKIILPMSVLDILSRLEVQYPILFELDNTANKRTTNAGVLEFNAEEGRVYLPHWMMRNLSLESGDIVNIKNVSLSAGQFAVFEPQSVDFLNISNPRAVLEKALRQFSCLTEGDVITLYYNDKEYDLRVLKTRPKKAISIIECDLSVEFAPPVGYVEPTPSAIPANIAPAGATSVPLPSEDVLGIQSETGSQPQFAAFSGQGHRVDGRVKEKKDKPAANQGTAAAVENNGKKLATADGGNGAPTVPYVRGRLHFTKGDPLSIPSTKLPDQEPASTKDDNTASNGFQAFGGAGQNLRRKK